jgi:hypothetical protein
MCQFEYFLLFVKFMLKLLVLKIKISGMILRNWIVSYWERWKREEERNSNSNKTWIEKLR